MTLKKAKKILSEIDYYLSVITNRYNIRSQSKSDKSCDELAEAVKTLLNNQN